MGAGASRRKSLHLLYRRIADRPSRREVCATNAVPNAIVEPSRDKRHNYVPVTYWTQRIQGAAVPCGAIGWRGSTHAYSAAPIDVRRLTRKQFIAFVGENARRAMAATGVPASVSVAQAILETGGGSTQSASQEFVRHQRPRACGLRPGADTGYIGGKWVTVDADFAKYDSFETEHPIMRGFSFAIDAMRARFNSRIILRRLPAKSTRPDMPPAPTMRTSSLR